MAVTRDRQPKDLYEDWEGNLDTLWSIGSWIQEEAEQQKNKNKQKKKSSEINVATASSSVVNDKFTTIKNSVDTVVDRIIILENRVSAVEEELENRVSAELQHKSKKRKIKIKIRC